MAINLKMTNDNTKELFSKDFIYFNEIRLVRILEKSYEENQLMLFKLLNNAKAICTTR